MMNYRKSILNSSIGNIIEWYDFGLFTIFASLFSQLFFPSKDPHVALIATFGIFAIGFICRPLGALIFGYLGDKHGRASTLRLSILMILLPTLLIGLIPTYDSIGIFAPLALLLIRMWQGISIGGEYSGNLIYLAETAPYGYRATVTSFASVGANVGILLAALVGIITTSLFSETSLAAWGWRVPYILSGILCFFIYQYRLRLQETSTFTALQKQRLIKSNPIKTVFTANSRELLRTLGLVCMGSTFYYFCFIYLPIFIKQIHHISLNHISMLVTLLIGIMIIMIPFCGYLSDSIGRRKMLLFNSALVTLIIIPGFYFLQTDNLVLMVAILILFTIASSLEQGTTSAAVVENFPPAARYTGVSLGYNLGNGFLGGSVPMICEWLLTNTTSPLAPSLYVATFALITFLVVYFFIPETRYSNLSDTL